MALIALASASGAPGVTTSALGLTLVWPRPSLLVEADVVGGSSVLAGYLRGSVSPEGRTLVSAALAHRQGRLDVVLDEQPLALDDTGERRLLPAISEPAQAASLTPVWGPLATALAALERDGVDVVVDAGRLGAAHGPEQLVRQADLVLLVTRTQLPAVASARARAVQLREDLAAGGLDADALGLLLVGEGRPYTSREIARATGVPVVSAVAWEPAAASVLSSGVPRPRRWDQSAFVRSLRSTADAAESVLQQRRARLGMTGAGAASTGSPVLAAAERGAHA